MQTRPGAPRGSPVCGSTRRAAEGPADAAFGRLVRTFAPGGLRIDFVQMQAQLPAGDEAHLRVDPGHAAAVPPRARRQSRRDRDPGLPRAARARLRVGGRVLRGRPRFAARTRGRRRTPDRPGGSGRELPLDRAHPRGGPRVGCRGDPSRLRVPGRERGLRTRLRRGGTRLDRAAGRRDRGDGLEDRVAAAHGGRGRAGRARERPSA